MKAFWAKTDAAKAAKRVDSGPADKSGAIAQTVKRRARTHAQTRPSPARNRRPGLRVSLSRPPGRSGIGIN